MVEFVNLWAFALLPIPIIVWLAFPVYKESKDSLQVPYFQRLVNLSGEKPGEGASVMTRARIQSVVLGLVWVMMVAAVAKPEWVGEPVNIEKSARDIMIAVDLSGSMQAEDFTTEQGESLNRLDAVKQVMSGFIENRQSDRLGLIVFGDAPYLQAPFTDDHQAWQVLLDETAIGMAGQSTAFGDAIGLAISVLAGAETQQRVLIVLTDGNDTGSKVPPVEAAKVAAANDVTIYPIAVGDPATTGEEAIDETVLQEIASITEGEYFIALDRDQLSSAYQRIDQLEPELYQALSYRPRENIFYIPLAASAIIYLCAFPFFIWLSAANRGGQS